MCTWHSTTTVPGSPTEVLALLTEPEAIARWAPVPFEVMALDSERLEPGSHGRVAGQLAGRPVEFDINVLRASGEGLELVAQGPICLDVKYRVTAAGSSSEVEASIAVQGRGLFGRLLAKATEALLAAGALRTSLERMARELQPVIG